MTIELVGQPCLGSEVIESDLIRQTIGVLWEETSLLMPFTLECRVGIGDTGVGIQTLEVVCGISPHLVAVGHRAIVIAEAIPLVDDAVGVEEVNLTLRSVTAEVTLGELIYVISEVCSE